MMRCPLLASVAAACASAATADGITVDNCGDPLDFDTAPERIVVHDKNMTDMAFELELQDKIVGLTGITGWYKTSPEFDNLRGDIPELAPKIPAIKNLISVEPDLFLAGSYYGMRPGGDVTPDTLAPFGIKTIVLTESCGHLYKDHPFVRRHGPAV